MSIRLAATNGSTVLEAQASSKLDHQDYELFVPEFERLLKQHGKIGLLFEMVDFHGWDAAAAWDDVKFDVKHFSDITRVAMVGDKKWEKGMTAFCHPFTAAEVRYFEANQIGQARTWVAGGGS